MTQAVQKVFSGMALAVAFGIAVGPPITYLLSAYDAQKAVVKTEAEINGRLVSQLISANPGLWHYEVERLGSLLARRPGERTPEIRRVLDNRGVEITASKDVIEAPIVTEAVPLRDSGITVGQLEISRSQRPILLAALGIALMSSLLAFLAHLTLRRLPMRALHRALGELESARKETLEVQHARDRAETSARLKATFLSQMSHELRTPMNGVMGMIDLTLCTELSEEQRDYLSTAYSSAEHLMRILNDILDLSRIEADKLDLLIEPFSLETAVGQCVRLLEPAANAKGLHLSTEYSPDLPAVVLGDAGRLRQVLANLIGNALKFTHEGGVLISLALVQKSGDKPHILFSVSDTGIGIPPDHLNSIFEAFSQVDASITRRYGGTGLGLTITRKLVELMGGHMRVESTEGSGSTFLFELPFAIPAKAA